METKGEQGYMNSDYFAKRLLEKLDAADPVFAAYEAQDVSRDVGFDFADFQDVVPRALDEVRETKEAFEEEGPEGREHFGDEIADIMFSLINLARHAGQSNLPTFAEIAENASDKKIEDMDTLSIVDGIGAEITRVAALEESNDPAFHDEMRKLLESGMEEMVLLAKSNDFDPQSLLVENVRKYLVRCQAIEQLASEDGKLWADLSANNEIVAYWKRAKTLLK